MTQPVLHYYHDPLCGWCYAAESLTHAAAATDVSIKLHGGGLWDQPISLASDKRAYIKVADGRIQTLTGQVFGAAYLDGLLDDPSTVFYSRPTIAAVLAAERLDAKAGLPMLVAIQRAHYVDGRKVVETPVLAALARGLGLDEAAFVAALNTVPVDDHIRDARAAMQQQRLHGFPSFVLERDGQSQRIAHEGCYSDPKAFVAMITNSASASPHHAAG